MEISNKVLPVVNRQLFRVVDESVTPVANRCEWFPVFRINFLKMKFITRILLFILTLFLLVQCEKDEPDVQVKIPDNNFLDALINQGVDANADGVITKREAEAITYMDVSYYFIQDLTGIEAFVNLDTLYAMYNQLTSMNISKCTSLVLLSCSNNWLTSLNISKNTALRELFCYNNRLTSLDVANNIALIALSCGLNHIDYLDVSNNTSLEKLSCTDNKLASLDVSKCTALKEIGCSGNLLTTLDVSIINSLSGLGCADNQLISLDISNNPAMEWLYCGDNQLTILDISNNPGLKNLHIENLPDLSEVCVWIMPFPPAGVNIYASGSPNIYFTVDCKK